eukprot:gene6685-7772_t
MTLDALGRKMIVTNFLEVVMSLLTAYQPHVYRHITRAVANLAETESNRVDLIECKIFDLFVAYIQDHAHHDDTEIALNICICFEYLSCEENILVRTNLAEKCLDAIVELSRSYNSQLKHSASIILLNLTKNTVTREQVIRGGAMQAFIAMALCEEINLQVAATHALSILSTNQNSTVEAGQRVEDVEANQKQFLQPYM